MAQPQQPVPAQLPQNSDVRSVYVGYDETSPVTVVSVERLWREITAPPPPVVDEEAGDGGVPTPPQDGPPLPPSQRGPGEGQVPVVVPRAVLAATAPVTADQIDDGVRQRVAELARTYRRGPSTYNVPNTADAIPIGSAVWCRTTATPAALARAVNRYLRVRDNEQTANDSPRMIAPPDLDAGQEPPGVYLAARGESPHFEYWLNETMSEVTDTHARDLVYRILQGANGRPRQLPRTPAEVQLRTDELVGYQQHRLRAWLDDDEAVEAMHAAVRFAYLNMTPSADRRTLLEDFTPGGSSVAYHGTGRAPDVLLRTGTAPKVNYETHHQRDWHPFAATAGRAGMKAFRRRSGDNELYTTVSIAQSAFESIDFPLIEPILKANDRYKAEGAALAAGRYTGLSDVQFTVRTGAPGTYLTDSWVYIVLVDTVYDTKKLQSAETSTFDSPCSETTRYGDKRRHGELATDTILPARHIAALRYERLHFGPTREHGMAYRLAEVRHLIDVPDSYGTDDTPSEFHRIYSGLMRKMPLCGVKIGTVRMTGRVDGIRTATRQHLARPDCQAVLRGITEAQDALPPAGERKGKPELTAVTLNRALAAVNDWWTAQWATSLAEAETELVRAGRVADEETRQAQQGPPVQSGPRGDVSRLEGKKE